MVNLKFFYYRLIKDISEFLQIVKIQILMKFKVTLIGFFYCGISFMLLFYFY